jgi:ABC-2 type transport system permease protein
MKYAFLVAWREYAESAKAKGFWLGIFLMPAILFLSIQAPIWLEEKATPVRYYVLVDQSGTLAPAVESALERNYQKRVFDALGEYARKNSSPSGPQSQPGTPAVGENPAENLDQPAPRSLDAFVKEGGKGSYLERLRPHLKPGAPPFQEPRRQFKQVKLPPDINPEAGLPDIAQKLRPYLRDQKQIETDGQKINLSAAILIPDDLDAQIIRPQNVTNQARFAQAAAEAGSRTSPSPHSSSATHPIQFWSVNASDPRLRDDLERAINSEIRRREYLARGMDAAAIRQVEQTYAPFASLNPKKEKGKEAVSTADTIKQWAPSGFVYLLWLAIFVIVQMLLNNTIEEKSNRIIEVLLSSVTPGELMMGKLLGIAAIGLTMVGAWMLGLFGILSWKAGGTSELAGHLLALLKSSNLVPLFSIYFLLGYLMYAGLILSIGSVCNTIKEAQSYMGVLTMIMMVPLLTMTFIPKDPNGPLARLLSWIPLYTPFTMMNRAAADPPLFDLIGTFVLLLATTAVALLMTGKIFRIGILRTGQPPKLLEMFRWAVRKSP